MRTAKTLSLALLVIAMSVRGWAEEVNPTAIFDKVIAKYAAMDTYKAEGTTSIDIATGGMKINAQTDFSMLLKKPNLYLITWTQNNFPMPGMVQSGAVWSDGTQPCLYMGVMNAYSKIANDQSALAAATGISGGAAFTIPTFFLSLFKDQPSPFSGLIAPKLEGTEKAEGEECYVISGSSAISKKETFWISKERYLIVKCSRSVEAPEGGRTVPEMTDEELEKAIKDMGQEVTKESKEEMKNIMKMAKDSAQTPKEGTITEIHRKITTPELRKKDFEFKLPEGTNLKSDLFTFEGVDITKTISENATFLGMEGRNLSDKEVEKLEVQLKTDPNDLSLRTKLLGYYSSKQYQSDAARKARQKHIIWIIQNRPDAEIAGLPYTDLHPKIDGDAYKEAKELWLKQVETHQNNTAILGNAANFFLIYDKDLAESLLQKAQSLEPNNPAWSKRIGNLYALHAPGAKDEKESAAKSLKQLESALSGTTEEIKKFYMLDELAKVAFEAGELEKARIYASELLKQASQYKNDWNYGNAIHHGNLILGRFALKAGDVKKAGGYLLEAGKTPGSPQLNSFGPNMALAKELLEKGQREIVINYFQLCANFWETHKEELAEWTSIVNKGAIPDFGANLNY